MASRVFELIFRGDASQLQGVVSTAAGTVADLGTKVGGAAGKFTDISVAAAGFLTSQAIQNAPGILGGIADNAGLIEGAMGGLEIAFPGAAQAVEDGVGKIIEQLAEKYGPAIIGAATAGWAWITELYAQAVAIAVGFAPITAVILGLAALGVAIYLVIDNFDAIKAYLRDHWMEVGVMMLAPFVAPLLIANDIFGIKSKVLGGIDDLLGAIPGPWGKIGGLLAAPFVAVLDKAEDAWGVKTNVLGAFDFIVGGIDTFKTNAANALGAVASVVGANAEAIGGAIKDGLKGGINGAISLVNSFIRLVDSVSIHIPAIGVGPVHTPAFDWNGLGIPEIPQLAAGGIVTRPTLAMIGEAGPEAVIPLGHGFGGPQIIQLVVDGAVLAEVVNRENGRNY